MEYIEEIRSSVGDAFSTLPLLIIGFTFFLGTLTSNIGLLYVFIGHLIVVPALSFLANAPGIIWMEGGVFAPAKIMKWIFSTLLVLGIHGNALSSVSNSSYSYLLYLALLIPLGVNVGAYFYSKNNNKVLDDSLFPPMFQYVNFFSWLLNFVGVRNDPPNGECSMLPVKEKGSQGTGPSSWVTHITFFFGFILTNALAVYNQPTPTVNTSSNDAKQEKDRKNRLELRVRNRKWLSMSIFIISLIAFIILLLFRYKQTDCESTFLHSLVPLVIIALTGSAWFNLIFNNCGVRPADVLGIVQGMISPDLIDNPIVCVGT